MWSSPCCARKRRQEMSCTDQRTGPHASLQTRAGYGVICDDPWFQFPRGAEQIYKTDLLVVKMINPLLDQLASRGDIAHAIWFAPQARANLVGR